MRVIAGEAKRIGLVTPKGNDTRPTGDKVKETLFNILAFDLYGSSFLDLFAGSGAIGIEALSRGAGSCTFVEKDREALSCIRKNLEKTHLSDKADVIAQDVLLSIRSLKDHEPFDFIFADPPYKLGVEKALLSALFGSNIMGPDTLLIMEAAADTDLSFAGNLGFEVERIKDYKNNKHVFLTKKEG